MAAAVIAPRVAHLNAQMKTDAYTECRGVGRIACDVRAAAGRGQACVGVAAVSSAAQLGAPDAGKSLICRGFLISSQTGWLACRCSAAEGGQHAE